MDCMLFFRVKMVIGQEHVPIPTPDVWCYRDLCKARQWEVRSQQQQSMLGRITTLSDGMRPQWWTRPDTLENCQSRKPSTPTWALVRNASTRTQAWDHQKLDGWKAGNQTIASMFLDFWWPSHKSWWHQKTDVGITTTSSWPITIFTLKKTSAFWSKRFSAHF